MRYVRERGCEARESEAGVAHLVGHDGAHSLLLRRGGLALQVRCIALPPVAAVRRLEK